MTKEKLIKHKNHLKVLPKTFVSLERKLKSSSTDSKGQELKTVLLFGELGGNQPKRKKNSVRNNVKMHIIFIRITSETKIKGRCNINTTTEHEKLLVNDKSTASCQTYMSPNIISNVKNNNNQLTKNCVIFISLSCFWQLFKCFTEFDGCSPYLNFDFRDMPSSLGEQTNMVNPTKTAGAS